MESGGHDRPPKPNGQRMPHIRLAPIIWWCSVGRAVQLVVVTEPSGGTRDERQPGPDARSQAESKYSGAVLRPKANRGAAAGPNHSSDIARQKRAQRVLVPERQHGQLLAGAHLHVSGGDAAVVGRPDHVRREAGRGLRRPREAEEDLRRTANR